jgi:hypothetical protein
MWEYKRYSYVLILVISMVAMYFFPPGLYISILPLIHSLSFGFSMLKLMETITSLIMLSMFIILIDRLDICATQVGVNMNELTLLREINVIIYSLLDMRLVLAMTSYP